MDMRINPLKIESLWPLVKKPKKSDNKKKTEVPQINTESTTIFFFVGNVFDPGKTYLPVPNCQLNQVP